MSRRKGKGGEREAEAALKQYGIDALRGAKAQVSGGMELPDVIARIGTYTMAIEVKRRKKVGMHEVRHGYEQARTAAANLLKAKLAESPVGYAVMHRSNYDEWFVTIDLATFAAILTGERYGVIDVVEVHKDGRHFADAAFSGKGE